MYNYACMRTLLQLLSETEARLLRLILLLRLNFDWLSVLHLHSVLIIFILIVERTSAYVSLGLVEQ